MSNEELSPMPTPVTEEPELVPGGVDDVHVFSSSLRPCDRVRNGVVRVASP